MPACPAVQTVNVYADRRASKATALGRFPFFVLKTLEFSQEFTGVYHQAVSYVGLTLPRINVNGAYLQ